MKTKGYVASWICLALWLLIAPATIQAATFTLNSGDYVVADWGANIIAKIDAATGRVQNIGSFANPTDVALAPDGTLYICQFDGYIFGLNLTNGALTMVNPNTSMFAVWGLEIGPNGDLYATAGSYDFGMRYDCVVKIDPATGFESVIAETNLLSIVGGLTLLDADHLLVCSSDLNNSAVVKVTISTGEQAALATSGPGVNQPRGVAYYGNNVYVTELDSRVIRRVPVTGGTLETLCATAGYAHGMAVESNGNIVAGTSVPAEILRINPDGLVLRTNTSLLLNNITGIDVSLHTVESGPLINTSPVLDPVDDQTVDEGDLISIWMTAMDTDWPPQQLTFQLGPGAPEGATLSPDGLFSWRPSELQGPSNYVITVEVVDDDLPPLTNSATFSVTVQEINSRPTIVYPVGTTNVAELSLVSFTASVIDPDWPAQGLTFSFAQTPPPGASLTTNGLFTWTPTEAQGPSNYVFKIKVQDDGVPPLAVTNTFTVNVLEVNTPPSFTSLPDRTIDEGDLLSFKLQATDDDIPEQTLTFGLAGSVPPGVTVTPEGTFSWTPTDDQGPGTNLICVWVKDNGTPSLTTTQCFAVVINELYLQCTTNHLGIPFSDVTDAVFDKAARTITVDRHLGQACFYRLRCNIPVRITRMRLLGNQVLLEYQFL